MTNRKNETVTLRDTALAFDDAAVKSVADKIAESFARRDAFEAAHGNSVTAKNGYTKARDRMIENSIAVARFMLALNVAPSAVIERQKNSASMFNVYALDKVTELARFVCGYGESLQAVTKCFLLCAIKATRNGMTVITNDVNQRFLNSFDVSSLKDAKLIEYIEANRHKSMSTGAATQSSQMRNVIDALRIGSIHKVTRDGDSIVLKSDHAFLDYIESACVSASKSA